MPSDQAKSPRRGRRKFTGQRPATGASMAPPRPRTRTLQGGLCPLFAVGSICAVHATGVALLFGPINGLFDNNPLIDQDWGLHFQHMRSLEAFWRDDGRLWGYNPYFMAGFPSNTIQDLSIKLFELLALGLSSLTLTPLQWFKIVTFLAVAITPGLSYFSARNFFVDRELAPSAALAATVLGTLYWWNSLPREMFFYGMIGFPVAAYVSLWGVSLIYRIARQARSFSLTHVGWLAFAMLILPLHVQALLILLPPLLALSWIEPKHFTPNLVLSILGAAVLSLAANGCWLIPAIAHRGDDVSLALVAQLPLFASMDPFAFITDYLGPRGYWTFRPGFLEKGLRLVLLILGLLGLRHLIRGEQRALGIMLAWSLVGLFLLTYFGAFIPFVKAWQPLRFKIPFDLFLIIAAAYAVARQLARNDVTKSPMMPLLLGAGALAFGVNLAQTESAGRMRLRTQLHPDLVRAIEWIERETPTEGRILFEESGDETGFVHDGVYLSNFVAAASGRQLIGGPINLYNDRHHFAEFHSGKLFKRDIGALSDAELQNYLQLYNIGAIAAFHPASIKRFQAIPGSVTFDQRIGALHLFKVNQTLSWFVEGQGKLTARLNRLELSQLSGNPIIVKYHWLAGLTSEPAAKIEPVKLADDPIPFIKIIDAPTALTLRLGP
jgi:hypothetical protein